MHALTMVPAIFLTEKSFSKSGQVVFDSSFVAYARACDGMYLGRPLWSLVQGPAQQSIFDSSYCKSERAKAGTASIDAGEEGAIPKSVGTSYIRGRG